MSDLLGMDPARIERLRSPDRLTYFDPDRIWNVVGEPAGPVVDIGCGVGFLTLPIARRLPDITVYGCDILEGMVQLLEQSAHEQSLPNLRALLMCAAHVPLPDDCAELVVMAQVHHELDDPQALLAQCRRLVMPAGKIAIIDWKDEENGKSPPAGRRIPESTILNQLERAGFTRCERHDVYEFHSFVTGTGHARAEPRRATPSLSPNQRQR